MAKVKLTKKEADRIMKIKGNTRGITFKTGTEYMLKRKGKKGLTMVEKRLTELGYPVKLKKISPFKWYSLALDCLVLLVVLEVFGWGEKEAFNMGYESPLSSIFTKILMQFLVPNKFKKLASNYWRKYFDFGKLEIVNYSEKEKYGIIRLNGWRKYHPLICLYNQGYFLRIIEMGLIKGKVKVEHTKCLFRNDPYEEFRAIWK